MTSCGPLFRLAWRDGGGGIRSAVAIPAGAGSLRWAQVLCWGAEPWDRRCLPRALPLLRSDDRRAFLTDRCHSGYFYGAPASCRRG